MFIIARGEKFLSEFYRWGDAPNPFEEWRISDVLTMAHGFKDKPTHLFRVNKDGTWERLDVS